eukprot:351080-Rhodomonas_salina.3
MPNTTLSLRGRRVVGERNMCLQGESAWCVKGHEISTDARPWSHDARCAGLARALHRKLSLIHISEPTRPRLI